MTTMMESSGRQRLRRRRVRQVEWDEREMQRNVDDIERMASGLAGAVLTGVALRRRTPWMIPIAAVGGALLVRAATGHSHLYDAIGVDRRHHMNQPQTVKRAVTIERPVSEVYNYWRQLENLPNFMRHLQSVTMINDRVSRWVTRGPAGKSISWDAEITDEKPNEHIAWHSLPGSSVPNAGRVRFVPNGDDSTEVHVTLHYSPPAGKIGQVAAKLVHKDPVAQIRDDLRRFKQIMETGEITTSASRPEDADDFQRGGY